MTVSEVTVTALRSGRSVTLTAPTFRDKQRTLALRVVDAQQAVDAAKGALKEAKEELAMAWTDLREHALNEEAEAQPRQAGFPGEPDEGEESDPRDL